MTLSAACYLSSGSHSTGRAGAEQALVALIPECVASLPQLQRPGKRDFPSLLSALLHHQLMAHLSLTSLAALSGVYVPLVANVNLEPLFSLWQLLIWK